MHVHLNNYFKYLGMFLILGLAMPPHLSCREDHSRNESRLAKLKEDFRKADVLMRFYGRVVDQYDHPVEGAEIKVDISRFTPSEGALFYAVDAFSLKTDPQGCFTVEKKGREMSIESIERRGYEWGPFHNLVERDYVFSRPKLFAGPIFTSDPKNPVVFRVRKRGEETFVLIHSTSANFQFKESKSGTEEGIDVIRGHQLTSQEMKTLKWAYDEPLLCDLKAKATWDPKARAWTVTLTPGTPGGGILASEQFLYEAPKEGYQPSLTLAPGPNAPKIRCFYLRSREPFIYTRLDVGGVMGELMDIGKKLMIGEKETHTSFGVDFKIAVNPYGERNFEMDPHLNYDVRKALDNEARESYRLNVNGRPPKPDLPKLIKEAEEKERKEKSLLHRIFGK